MTLRPITTHYERPGTTDAGRGAMLFAGGTDIIPLARSGVVDAPDLVDIKATSMSTTIEAGDDEWTIGALVTLTELEHHEGLRRAVPAIAEALSQAATRQIRNRATVGGNLLQRPRCSYFRDPNVMCWMKGGSDCPARNGRNEHLALGGDNCVAPQPSDLAAVLVALDAQVSIEPGGVDPRRSTIADFLVAPRSDHRSLNALGDGEVITAIHIPRPARPGQTTSVYLKAMDRAVWQFALVGVAAVVTVDSSGAVERARLCASGVANTPLELAEAADSLVGAPLSTSSIERAAAFAIADLDSLSENRFKISLLRGLIVRSLEATAR